MEKECCTTCSCGIHTDKLENIFRLQKALMIRLGVGFYEEGALSQDHTINRVNYPGLHIVEQGTKDMLFAICCELGEIGDEINWKPWKRTMRDINLDALRTELIDVFHFILEIMIMWGMTPTDIYNYYVSKNKENHDRQDRKY